MRILTRYKNQNGLTVGYDIQLNNGEICYFDRFAAMNLADQIDNAILTKSAEFRANEGCHIDTVVGYTNLDKRGELQQVVSQCSTEFDYYGKDYIDICKRIRKYALENKLTIDLSENKSNNENNTHLLKLMGACNIGADNFVKNYLYNLQPYSLSKFQGSKALDKTSVWLSDMGYGNSLAIKINESDGNNPIVVSFHKSDFHGNYTIGNKDFSDKPCAVFVDKVAERPNCLGVDFTVQRGFISYIIHSITEYCKNDVALVDYKDIKTALDDTLNSFYKNLADTYLVDNDDSSITLNSTNLSFMTQGYSVADNICLMIDLYSKYTDSKSRKIVCDLTMNLLSGVPFGRLDELKLTLKQKNINSRNKLYLIIMEF